jgi:hypothetical protein
MGDVRQPQRCIEPDALPESTESLESQGIMLRQAPPRLPCQDTMTCTQNPRLDGGS